MSREKRKAKKEAEKRLSTRQFIGAKEITDYSLVTYGQGELVYFIVKPTNISVLSESSVGARIYALMTVLKGVAEIEMLCLNSRESFEDNKRFLKSQMEQEENPVIRRLLEQLRLLVAIKRCHPAFAHYGRTVWNLLQLHPPQRTFVGLQRHYFLQRMIVYIGRYAQYALDIRAYVPGLMRAHVPQQVHAVHVLHHHVGQHLTPRKLAVLLMRLAP